MSWQPEPPWEPEETDVERLERMARELRNGYQFYIDWLADLRTELYRLGRTPPDKEHGNG